MINALLAVTPNTGCAPFNWLIVDGNGIEHPGKPSSRISAGVSSDVDLALTENEYLLVESVPPILFSKLAGVRVSLNCRYQTPVYNAPMISIKSMKSHNTGINNATLSVANNLPIDVSYQLRSDGGGTNSIAMPLKAGVPVQLSTEMPKLVLVCSTATGKYEYVFDSLTDCNLTVTAGPVINNGDNVDRLYPAFSIITRDVNAPNNMVGQLARPEYSALVSAPLPVAQTSRFGTNLLYLIFIIALIVAAVWYWRRHYVGDTRSWRDMLHQFINHNQAPTE